MKLMHLSFSAEPFGKVFDMEKYYQSQFLRGHVAYLEKHGWDVDVFTDDVTQNTWYEEKICEKSRLIHLPVKEKGYLPRGEIFTYLPDFLVMLKKWVEERGLSYSLIHSNHWLSGWIGRQLQQDWSVPHIHIPFSLGIKHAEKQEISRYTPLGRRILEETKTLASADAVVVSCPEERDVIWRRYGLRSVDIQINPCGVDANTFNMHGSKAARPRGKKIILYTGGLRADGGLHTLMDALRGMLENRPRFARGIELWILGTPPAQTLQQTMDAQQLGQLAQVLAFGEFVRFLGMPAAEKIAEYYRAADVCIIPNAAKGLGISALEAMASGCPVVAPRNNWLRHIVLDGETGLLVPPNDSMMLAQTLERLLSNPGLRRRMGQRAAKWVREGFEQSDISKRWNNIYLEVLYEHERLQCAKPNKAKQIC